MWGGKEEDIRRQELLLLLLLLLFLLVLVVVFAVERIIPLRFLLFFFLQAHLAPPSGSTSKKEKRVWMCGPRPPLRRSSGFLLFEADVGEAASRRAGSFNKQEEKFVRTREEDVSDPKERPGGTHSLGDPLVEMIESRNSCRGISSSPSRRTGRHRN